MNCAGTDRRISKRLLTAVKVFVIAWRSWREEMFECGEVCGSSVMVLRDWWCGVCGLEVSISSCL